MPALDHFLLALPILASLPFLTINSTLSRVLPLPYLVTSLLPSILLLQLLYLTRRPFTSTPSSRRLRAALGLNTLCTIITQCLHYVHITSKPVTDDDTSIPFFLSLLAHAVGSLLLARALLLDARQLWQPHVAVPFLGFTLSLVYFILRPRVPGEALLPLAVSKAGLGVLGYAAAACATAPRRGARVDKVAVVGAVSVMAGSTIRTVDMFVRAVPYAGSLHMIAWTLGYSLLAAPALLHGKGEGKDKPN